MRLSTTLGDFAVPLLRAEGLQVEEPARSVPKGSNVERLDAQAFDVAAPFAIMPANSQSGNLLYGTFLGGSGKDRGWAFAVERGGQRLRDRLHPVQRLPHFARHLRPSLNGSSDAFVVRLNPAGSGLDYATFLGGSDSDVGETIAVDGAGRAYVTGGTGSSDFPTTPGRFRQRATTVAAMPS